MNKPLPSPLAVDGFGPVDEHGQQIWSPAEAAAIAGLDADPAYWTSIAQAEEDIAAGRVYTTDEVRAHIAEVKRAWRVERGLR